MKVQAPHSTVDCVILDKFPEFCVLASSSIKWNLWRLHRFVVKFQQVCRHPGSSLMPVPCAQHPLPSPAPSYCISHSARAVPCPHNALWSCLLASRTEANFQRNVACPATSIVRWAKSISITASPHRPTARLPFSNLHTLFWESSMPASTPELHHSFTSYSPCAQFFTDITMSWWWWWRWEQW